MSTGPQADAENWAVTCWPEGHLYQVISLHGTRAEAVAAAACHSDAQLMFCAVPASSFDQRDEF